HLARRFVGPRVQQAAGVGVRVERLAALPDVHARHVGGFFDQIRVVLLGIEGPELLEVLEDEVEVRLLLCVHAEHGGTYAQKRADASVRTARNTSAIRSSSASPAISGGASCTTGSPRSSARAMRPA